MVASPLVGQPSADHPGDARPFEHRVDTPRRSPLPIGTRVRCGSDNSSGPSVEFGGSSRSQYQQIGNAVAVLLGKALGVQIAGFLDGAHLQPPPAPPWRQSSANRRIGTHGWAIPMKGETAVNLNVKVRADHVWAPTQMEVGIA